MKTFRPDAFAVAAHFLFLSDMVDPAFDAPEEIGAIVARCRSGHVFGASDPTAANSSDGRAHLPTQYLSPQALRGRP